MCYAAWVACIGAVMYTLVAQVDSPVAKYVVCNWDSESEHMKDECSWFQLQEVPNPIDCTDAHLDIGTYERTACQTQRVDYIHSSLSTANSFVTFAFAILLVVAIINRSVRRQFVEKDTQPDPFTKFVICVLSACAFCMSVLLVFFAMRWWNYTYTAVMYVAAGAFTAPVLSLSCYAIILGKKALLPVTNILLPINLAGLFSSAVFGGFFTGNLQTVSEMYHRNYHQIRTDVEKVMPSVCAGMSDAECKARMKVLTLEQLSVAGDFLWCFVLFLLAIIALTWRAVTHFSDSLTSLHGLSRFGLDTIEKVVHLQRDEIVSVADLFWNILHHPHRPMNEVILRQQSDTNGSLAALEVTLRENERKRLWSTPAKALQEECLSLGLDPLGSKHDLRRRLLSAYSSERMQRAADKDNSGEQVSEESKIEESKGHFYVVGEAELRLIPALAFCPFLDRLIDVFGEDKRQGLLHFEEFLNLYSIFSETCPLEEKIKYAWSVYDFLGSGDIRTEEVKAVVTHILGVTQAEMSDSVDEGKAVSSMQPEPEPAPEPEPEPESELDLAARMLGGIEVVSGRPISTPATSEPAQESAGDDLLMELDELAQFDAEPSADPSTGTALDLLADLDDLDTETSTPDKMRTGSSVDLEPEPESVSTPEANKSQQQQQQQQSVLQRFGSVLPGVDPSQHHIEKQAMRDARERKRREELRKASNEKLQQKRAERRHKARDEVQQLVQLVIDEVDEDGDGVMNFHEFRKALLKSTTFHERFQLPAPNITELLPFPSSEEMDSDDDTTLTDDDKVLMDQFAAGHRRRRKSLEGQPHSIPIDTTSQGRFTNPMHASDQSKTIEASPAALVMSDMFSNLGIKKKRRAPNDDQKRQKMWQHFQEKQEERRKQAAEKHKLGEDLVRPPHLELTENPNRCRSIYSKLVAQYLNDESIKQQQKFDRKRQREDYNHGQALRHRVSGVASAGKSPKATFNSMIGLDWNQVDVNGALVTRSLKNVGKQIIGVFVTVVETFETIQHQDKIPLFRRSVQTIEGEFGAGIASVFSLKRWLLCINAYMALFWTLTIILPSLVINEEEQSQVPQQVPTANAISSDSGVWHITNSSLQEGELPSFAWLYYSTYPARLGTYRLDFWYLATVVLLYCFNMSGVMRNIAWTTKIRFQNSLSDGDRSFAASSLVFGAYDYRASMRKIVAQNQKQTRNHLRTVLMKERAKAERLVGKFKGQLKRGAGLIASVMLASLMGTSIIFVIQNTLWLQKWSPVPNTTNNLITLIKISIPKVVPLIVRREGRKDVSDIMQTVIRRVYLCQMISLGLLFKELLDLQNTASENGECFEDVAGKVYLLSLATDFFAEVMSVIYGCSVKLYIYVRLVHGGLRGHKQRVPPHIARVLCNQQLPRYESEDAAVEVISNISRT